MSFRLHLILLLNIFAKVYCLNLTQNFESGCDQIFTKRQFVLESPQYPSNYPMNFRCSYLIKGPTCPTYFTLQLLDFNLEDSTGCVKDRLEVGDVDAICGTKSTIKTYFSDTGTLLLRLISDGELTGRGFRILVTRSPCNSTNPNRNYPTTKLYPNIPNDVEITTKKTNFRPPQHRKCCQNFYQSKLMILTSPNFPNSMSAVNDCIYEIRKFNSNICRLKIHVQFFWLGEPNQDCREGYLQIDGKSVCGCKSDLKLISPFTANTKILRFVSRGIVRNSYSGFVLEILQEECPDRYTRTDQTNRISTEKLQLINENTEIIDDNNPELHHRKSPEIIKHFYVFSDPFDWLPGHREREEVDYIDTSIDQTIPNDNSNYNYCLNWNIRQFNYLSRQNFDRCTAIQPTSITRNKCLILNYLRGYLKSPGYPFFYPGNLNICYRFERLPGYCSIRIYMNDFNIENSLNCEKDSLTFQNSYKYCGNSLMNLAYTLDLASKSYEDVTFRSDHFYCNRGFFATYEQLPCQNRTPPDVLTTTTPHPVVACRRTIQERLFSFDVFDYNEPTCAFVIRKYRPEVCKLRLYFEKFDLVCASESVVIDGVMYCGQMTGRTITIDLELQSETVITYKRLSNYRVNGLRFQIKGTQIDDDCLEPQVPAERSLEIPAEYRSNNSTYMVKFSQNFKDICGIITNSTEVDLPETFCEFIENINKNITKCSPIIGNSLEVPFESQKIRFDIEKADKVEQIQFEVVDCDEMSNL